MIPLSRFNLTWTKFERLATVILYLIKTFNLIMIVTYKVISVRQCGVNFLSWHVCWIRYFILHPIYAQVTIHIILSSQVDNDNFESRLREFKYI